MLCILAQNTGPYLEKTGAGSVPRKTNGWEEGYAADYDDFTNDAAVICAHHSDWVSAKYWATKAYEMRVAEFGEDSFRAKEVKAMFLNPRSDQMSQLYQFFIPPSSASRIFVGKDLNEVTARCSTSTSH